MDFKFWLDANEDDKFVGNEFERKPEGRVSGRYKQNLKGEGYYNIKSDKTCLNLILQNCAK
jgi:hypothetical protein